jgi:hypothetical protein
LGGEPGQALAHGVVESLNIVGLTAAFLDNGRFIEHDTLVLASDYRTISALALMDKESGVDVVLSAKCLTIS